MRGITRAYITRRLIVFFLTIWLSASIIFIIPRLAPGDPISAMVSRISQQSGTVEGADDMVRVWREKFGLDDPLPVQYVRYLGNLLTLDFGYSMYAFPTSVGELIGRALPWTIGLLSVALVLTFFIGNFLGAILAWRRTPGLVKIIIPFSMIFTAIPSILAALFLVYIFGFILDIFPYRGSYARGLTPGLNSEFILSVIEHGTLPALAIILVSFGYWTLGMRGMMITVEGEDYMQLAQAKGLRPFYVLYRYMIRNAILPQVTALAISMGTLVSGQILVEYIFTYRGMGSVIITAIRNQDFALIQGAAFVTILATAIAVLIIDLIYPLIDPRISLQGR
jgi:peptide/nickel transport system permease protein